MSLDNSEQAEIMQNFERGQRLYQTTHTSGWADVLDVLEAEVDKAEFRLLNVAPGSDPKLVNDLLMSARAYRSLFEQLQLQVARRIEIGINLDAIAGSEANYNNF